MAHQVTDAIQHFIGYLHISELLNLPAWHYRDAPVYGDMTFDHQVMASQWSLSPAAPDPAATDRPLNSAATPPSRLDPIETIRLVSKGLPLPTIGPSAPIQVEPDKFKPITDFQFGPALLPDVMVDYSYGGRQDTMFDVTQRNYLLDNDVVLDRQTLLEIQSLPPEIAELIDGGMSTVLEIIPADALSPFALPEGSEALQTHAGDDVVLDITAARGSSTAGTTAANGTFEDGIRVSVDGQTAEFQADELALVAERISAEGELGTPRLTAASVPQISSSNGFIPSPAQNFQAGANEQINVAMIYDLGDTFGSRIIKGDYYELNMIAQVNLLTGTGASVASDGLDFSVGPSNDLNNEASFLNEPGNVSGVVPAAGFNGATHWHVDYVNGSFVDSTIVRQSNFATDLDLAAVEQTQAYHLVTLGENDQLNTSTLLEIGKTYDLIIIGGNFYKYNAIIQVNIILDNDLAVQIGGQSNGSASTIGNLLENDAAIAGIGGQTFHAMNTNVTTLTDAISAGDNTLDPYITLGLPDNGDGVIDVLYVSGNYYSQNIIIQTNIIADFDNLTQIDPSELGTEQIISGGGNTALNGALIADFDSQSDYQFLGGEVYEDTLLVQANLLSDPEDLVSEASLHDQAVAVVASMTESAGDGADDDEVALSPMGTSADVLGSILS